MAIQIIGEKGLPVRSNNYIDFSGSYSVGGGTVGTTKPGPGQFFCFDGCAPDNWANPVPVISRSRLEELAVDRRSFNFTMSATAVFPNDALPVNRVWNLKGRYDRFAAGSGNQTVILDTKTVSLSPVDCDVYNFEIELTIPFYREFGGLDYFFRFFRLESIYDSACGEGGSKTNYWTGEYRIQVGAF